MNNFMKVNTQILKSIPIDSGLKRYLIKWFSVMCNCNGSSFAADKVKELRELLMQYIADPNHHEKLIEFIGRAPIRKNHRLYQLFSYADTNPHAVLAFLKMYLGEAETLVSVEESQAEMHDLLMQISQPARIPTSLKRWLTYLRYPRKKLQQLYYVNRGEVSQPYHYVVANHTIKDWLSYWSLWKGRLLKASECAYRSTTYKNSIARVPVPSMYADALSDVLNSPSSEQFQHDVQDFLGFFPDSRGGYESIPTEILDWILSKEEPDRVFNLFELDDIVDSLDPEDWYVGQIHHIPKKGTIKRRPIAVPNRFLQKALLPYEEFLYKVLRGLPRDHTFNQTKSSLYIKHRLDAGFYTCSVDLSHATDYLPKAIADYIVDQILPEEGHPSVEARMLYACFGELIHGHYPNEDFDLSRKLFDFMSRAPWSNGEYLDSWKVGQPLGTLPSFGTLALEHNVLLESTALECGYIHSPYTVLGDDVLLFSKRMRRAYIELMQSLGVPISIHKSYEHNLVEFAGQIAIKNQPVRYTPDPNKVTWYNLFDYSRNSGFLLSYQELPLGIRRNLSRRAQQVSLTGYRFYRLCAELYFAYYGSPYNSYMDYSMRILPFFVEAVESDSRLTPDLPEQTSGWTVVDLYGQQRLAYTGRGYQRKLASNQWFKQKYKPCSTNSIIAFTMTALANANSANQSERH